MNRFLSLGLLSLTVALRVFAAHPFFCTDSAGDKVAVVAADGTVQWQFACKHPQDGWILANKDLLFCHAGGAIEKTPSGETVWEYKAGADTEVHSCQPLANGCVLIVENGPCRLIEVDRAGNIAKEIKLTPPPATVKVHDQFRGVRKTRDGHYLVSRKGEHQVEELDAAGTSLRRIPVPGDVHMALQLPNGHLLLALGEGHKIQELDANLNEVAEIGENDVPGNPLRLMTGFQRLPNGNTIYCNYLGHGHLGEQPQFFELDASGKLVWQFADHAHFKSINQIQVMDVTGDPAKGEILR
ncbi:MAG TPA: hypothetical protein VFJ90_00765 [Candidatus Didemnitutus sp.]|nr:hypothetical protein [Candidatus Didemnitutus sp.]